MRSATTPKDLGVNRKRLEELGKTERVRFVKTKLRNKAAEKALSRTKEKLGQSLEFNIDHITKKRFVLRDELRRLDGENASSGTFDDSQTKFKLSNKDKLMLKQRIPPLHSGKVPTTG